MLNIPHEFGGQTVGFITVTETGTPGYLGVKEQVRTLVLAHKVRFRPLRTDEVNGTTNVTTGMWKLTAPPSIAALAAKSTGEIVYDGTDSPNLPDEGVTEHVFLIDGFNQPKPEMHGAIHHVTVLCKKQDS